MAGEMAVSYARAGAMDVGAIDFCMLWVALPLPGQQHRGGYAKENTGAGTSGKLRGKTGGTLVHSCSVKKGGPCLCCRINAGTAGRPSVSKLWKVAIAATGSFASL